ncbi:hypothetical protein SRHO_G00158580 [Serrasalmus rhombeus]
MRHHSAATTGCVCSKLGKMHNASSSRALPPCAPVAEQRVDWTSEQLANARAGWSLSEYRKKILTEGMEMKCAEPNSSALAVFLKTLENAKLALLA